MTRTRFIAAGVAVLVFVGLYAWQQQREGKVRACLETGGDWVGTESACRYPNGRMLVRPDLKRV